MATGKKPEKNNAGSLNYRNSPLTADEIEVYAAAAGVIPPSTPPPVRRRKNMVPEREYSFQRPPELIPARDIKQNVKAEVVVVGGGVSGLSAALSAAEAGARTVLIEKMSTVQARGQDNAFIGSRLQKKLGIEIDVDEVVLNMMKYGANKPDQRLIRMWAEGSGNTANWLMDMTDAAGLEVMILQFPPLPAFDNATEYYPQYLVTHQYQSERQVAQCMLENALNKGVVTHFKTRAKYLLRRGKGRVTGLVAHNAAGDYVRFTATKAVILCTGDYGNNVEMMDKYCSHAAHLPSQTGTSTGDGHQMAMWAGAVMEPGPHAPMTHGPAGPAVNSPFLQVNLLGERFQNEDVPVQSNANAIQKQPGYTAWQVFDSKYPEEIPYMGLGLGKIMVVTEKVRQQIEKAAVKADTLPELAGKMGIPKDVFLATVSRYNELAQMGKDLDFGKRPDRLTTIEKPPYYAGKSGSVLLAVLGGLNVNARLQCLDKDWKVIPGLYLAGNTVGNRFGIDYTTMCPGISHGISIHHGRCAGINAATLE